MPIHSIFDFAIVTAAMFVVVMLRYFAVVGVAYYFFWYKPTAFALRRRLYQQLPPRRQIFAELYWSTVTSLIFAVIGAAMYWGWQESYVKTNSDAGFIQSALTLVLYALVHETYFYWVHRAMHLPALYKSLHLVHHHSVRPSPFASFSFHPLEAVLEALILPLLVLMIPAHPTALVIYLTAMTLSAAFNHLGHELFPANADNRFGWSFFIGAANHAEHHRTGVGNYGLYFTFWDRLLGTWRPGRKLAIIATQPESLPPQGTPERTSIPSHLA
jgi:sterol desaturase/sphingolipid hydroxylase (fatty acid hydroxylase superfamily)